MVRVAPVFWLLGVLAGCSPESEPAESASRCVPGESRRCPCADKASGVQACLPDGTFGACEDCSGAGAGGKGSEFPVSAGGASSLGEGGSAGSGVAGSGGTGEAGAGAGGAGVSGSGGDPCVGHCGNGAQDCGEAGVDCGGECPACPPPGQYVYEDCKSHEAVSNGSEDCDDTWLDVQPPGTQYALVCFSHAGGVAYASTNTGPVMSDGVARCQGWEELGQYAPDYLQYIAKMTCDEDQKTLPLDLTAYVGQSIHMGTHTNPDGSGHATVACIALKK